MSATVTVKCPECGLVGQVSGCSAFACIGCELIATVAGHETAEPCDHDAALEAYHHRCAEGAEAE